MGTENTGLYAQVQELLDRVAQLEGERKSPELSLRDRLDKERKERIEKSNQDEGVRRSEKNGVEPVNRSRREELRRTQMELRGHQAPARQIPAPVTPTEPESATAPSGNGITGSLKIVDTDATELAFVEWEDGFVTTEEDITATVPKVGINSTVIVWEPCLTYYNTLTFEDGILTSNVYTEVVP